MSTVPSGSSSAGSLQSTLLSSVPGLSSIFGMTRKADTSVGSPLPSKREKSAESVEMATGRILREMRKHVWTEMDSWHKTIHPLLNPARTIFVIKTVNEQKAMAAVMEHLHMRIDESATLVDLKDQLLRYASTMEGKPAPESAAAKEKAKEGQAKLRSLAGEIEGKISLLSLGIIS